MSVPEPLGFTRSILSFGLLFAGMPTGLIFYSGLVKKWLTPIAPKIIIGFVAFPIYTLAGVIGSISFIIYKGIFIFKIIDVNDNELFKSRVSMNYFLGQLLKDDQLHIWLFFE